MERPDLSATSVADLVAMMVACGTSQDPSDREFARACRDEIARRKPDDEGRDRPRAPAMSTEADAPPPATLAVRVGPELFRFESFAQWVGKAPSWFRNAGVPAGHILCVDSRGRVCKIGEHYMRADLDGTFPVVAYRIDVE